MCAFPLHIIFCLSQTAVTTWYMLPRVITYCLADGVFTNPHDVPVLVLFPSAAASKEALPNEDSDQMSKETRDLPCPQYDVASVSQKMHTFLNDITAKSS